MNRIGIVGIVSLLALSACAASPTPTPAPTVPAATPTASATSAAPTVAPEPTPTTPSPEPTPSPTQPASPVPSPEPTRVAEFITSPNGYRIWKPSFEILPFKEDVPQGTMAISTTGHGWTHEQIELASKFYASLTPPNTCAPIPDLPADPVVLEKAAYDYANCLLESWRPWAAEHDVPLPEDIPVRHCALPEHACADIWSGAYAYGGGEIVLAPFALGSGQVLTRVMAHEFGHSLQSIIRPNLVDGGVLGVGGGLLGPDQGGLGSRRHELQAECLGMASIDAYDDLTPEEYDHWPKNGSDEEHGDFQSAEFWSMQGLKGWIGECNTFVAPAELMTYEVDY